jgi:hypothetical protein
MKKPITIILLIFSYSAWAQSLTKFIKDNAREIKTLDALDATLYEEFKNFDLVMIGEMHGTRQPAAFASGLAKLVAQQGKSVSLGIEIPPAQMKAFLTKKSDLTLAQSEFFSSKNTDGRNGQAWYDLIKSVYKNSQIHLFFFDNPTAKNRDSSMYEEVKKQHLMYPYDKIITLSGNIHTFLQPFRYENTMGTYLAKDTLNFNKDKIMCINHFYKEGTLLNNSGSGLALQTVNNADNFLNTSVPYQNYFVASVFPNQKLYTHILFTTKVSHSEKEIKK